MLNSCLSVQELIISSQYAPCEREKSLVMLVQGKECTNVMKYVSDIMEMVASR